MNQKTLLLVGKNKLENLQNYISLRKKQTFIEFLEKANEKWKNANISQ